MADLLADIAASDVEDIVDALYGLDPDDFTRARNDAAKALRKVKRSDDAARIAKLAKPTAAAAALNQVVRRRPDLVESLRYQGDQLRRVQDRVLAGDADATMLTRAAEERRTAARAIVEALSDALLPTERRHTDEWMRTLEAASVDDAIGELLRRGRFTKVALEGIGFDGLLAAPAPLRHLRVAPEPSSPDDAASPADSSRAAGTCRRVAAVADRGATRRDDTEEAARQAEAARRREERERRITEAHAAESQARAAQHAATARHADAATALDLAVAGVRDSEVALRSAESELERARALLADAEREERQAREALDGADQEVAAARAALDALGTPA